MNNIVNTLCGPIKGTNTKVEGVVAFKGIRYAMAERFEYPKIITSWDGVYNATEYKHASYQPRSFYDEEKNLKKIFYYNEFRKGETYTYSEDCLFLNIFTCEGFNELSKMPVIIYIHGGGFTGGCANEKHFDGPIWPKKGVIAVTINYRLGPLGFACFKEQKENIGKTGNYGLYDQIAAITWIKNNISSFGGDPDNITIMGQSAGAMSVQQLSLSPLSHGLFHKAVMSSGGGVNKFLSTPSADKVYPLWDKVLELSECESYEQLKKVPVDILFDNWTKARKLVKGIMMPASPVIDNELILASPDELINKKDYMLIPYMIGSNSEDLAPPFLHSMAKKWCSKQDIPSYCYLFNHQLPGDNNGAWHSSDLWYFFGTLNNSTRPMTEVDYKLSDLMTSYLCNFAKTGNPNSSILPLWDNCTNKASKVMHFSNGEAKLKKVNTAKLWFNLFTKKAVGE